MRPKSDLLRALFESPLPGIRRPLTEPEGHKFSNYLSLLIKWQKTHRLIGSVEPPWVIENVFVASLCFLEALPGRVRRLADLGSGAGIPGIPIAIVRTDLRVSLIEARQRRVSFLSTVVRELELSPRVEIVAERAERLGSGRAGTYDAVVMRCAGEPTKALPAAFRLARRGGVVVVSAGSAAQPLGDGEVLSVRSPSGVLRTFHRYPAPEFGH